ncbi:universal stress protein [Crocosphaera sp. Alani8]|uniref:universal stress protein n=1 Tax=Crocosphaera sp. Alani8 TaxID=3038952 RepID=UPI00313BA98B
MLEKILYTDSGTGKTQEMLQVLMDLPVIKKANLNILHVVPPQITSDAIAAKWEEGGKLIAAILDSLKIDPTQVSTMLRQGDPKDTVCKVADEINADLIIMGSRGLQRLEAILKQSVSQYVFQLSNHPMLLVRDDVYVKKIKRVMVALDKSPAAEYALDLALYLLRDYQEAELILARVNPDIKPELLPLSKEEMENNPIVSEAAIKAKQKGIPYRCAVTGGRPAKQICELAEEFNVDLLLLGSPDRRPSIAKALPDLDRLLGTSLSDYIRVKANCPVLMVRKEGL